jgi:hypothetical protein
MYNAYLHGCAAGALRPKRAEILEIAPRHRDMTRTPEADARHGTRDFR